MLPLFLLFLALTAPPTSAQGTFWPYIFCYSSGSCTGNPTCMYTSLDSGTCSPGLSGCSNDGGSLYSDSNCQVDTPDASAFVAVQYIYSSQGCTGTLQKVIAFETNVCTLSISGSQPTYPAIVTCDSETLNITTYCDNACTQCPNTNVFPIGCTSTGTVSSFCHNSTVPGDGTHGTVAGNGSIGNLSHGTGAGNLKGLPPGAVAGIVIGVIAAVFGVLAVGYVLVRRRQHQKPDGRETPAPPRGQVQMVTSNPSMSQHSVAPAPAISMNYSRPVDRPASVSLAAIPTNSYPDAKKTAPPPSKDEPPPPAYSEVLQPEEGNSSSVPGEVMAICLRIRFDPPDLLLLRPDEVDEILPDIHDRVVIRRYIAACQAPSGSGGMTFSF